MKLIESLRAFGYGTDDVPFELTEDVDVSKLKETERQFIDTEKETTMAHMTMQEFLRIADR